MTMFKCILGFMACGTVGTVAGVAARAIYWHTLGVSVIDEKTLAPVGVIVGVTASLVTGAYFVGRMLKGWEDRFDIIEAKLDKLPCQPPVCCTEERKHDRKRETK